MTRGKSGAFREGELMISRPCCRRHWQYFLLFPQQLVEIRDRFFEAIAQLHLWLPSQQGLGKTDVRAALLRIILWQRMENDFRRRARELDDLLGELPDREL